jgi:predicted nucleic acid-binding protein
MAADSAVTSPVCFVDTAVLLAADDAHDLARQATARAWLEALWQSRSGRVSTQVLSEYYVIATRHYGMPAGDARAKLRRYQLWPWRVDRRRWKPHGRGGAFRAAAGTLLGPPPLGGASHR